MTREPDELVATGYDCVADACAVLEGEDPARTGVEDAALTRHTIPLRRNRDFLLLTTGRLLSSAGTQLSTIAYPLLALALTHSATKAGVVAFARGVPAALFALPSGLAADHFSRKRLMIASDAVGDVVAVAFWSTGWPVTRSIRLRSPVRGGVERRPDRQRLGTERFVNTRRT